MSRLNSVGEFCLPLSSISSTRDESDSRENTPKKRHLLNSDSPSIFPNKRHKALGLQKPQDGILKFSKNLDLKTVERQHSKKHPQDYGQNVFIDIANQADNQLEPEGECQNLSMYWLIANTCRCLETHFFPLYENALLGHRPSLSLFCSNLKQIKKTLDQANRYQGSSFVFGRFDQTSLTGVLTKLGSLFYPSLSIATSEHFSVVALYGKNAGVYFGPNQTERPTRQNFSLIASKIFREHQQDEETNGQICFRLEYWPKDNSVWLSPKIETQYIGENLSSKQLGKLLCEAAEVGRTETVDLLLSRKAEVNYRKEDRSTALFIASHNGCDSIVKRLLDSKADPNKARISGATPLYVASQNGHEPVVKLLLDGKSDANQARKNGSTPLYIAARENYASIVQLLLSSKADVNHEDEDGDTPLYGASQKGNASIVELLLSHNADANQENEEGDTPLDVATQKGFESVKQLLTQSQSRS